VYEHRDCFGVPRYVGQTELVPEEQFRADLDHPGVRKTLRQPRTGRQGSSEVVWAGFGTGPVGAQQMADMRMAVQHVRAVRAWHDRADLGVDGESMVITCVTRTDELMRRARAQERVQAAKLSGFKPWSRHGAMALDDR
jgi:hypothetical protein